MTVSGFPGTSYPDDVTGQHAIYKPLLDAVVIQLLGQGIEYDLNTRRGAIRRGTLPPVEVDLRVPQLALKFRTEGARLSRAKQVRIEVLKALASKVSSTSVLAYCVAKGPRPKLSVGPPQGNPGKRVGYFYADAIKRYGYLLEEQNLSKAYERCQLYFTGDCLGREVICYLMLEFKHVL